MISSVTSRFARLMTLIGCSACIVACEAVPTEEQQLQKELAGKVSMGIRVVESQLLPEQPMEVLFYLNNATDASIEVLPWGTPLEKIMTADRFTIIHDGEPVAYNGIMVKRAAPGPDDYLTLAAGEKREAVVNLADGYDVSAAGKYEVTLKSLGFQNQEGSFLDPVPAESTLTIVRQ